VNIGDVVLIYDDTPRVQWKLAMIKQVNKGVDGLIQSANVRTTTGRTNRSIARLYPLDVTTKEEMSKPTTVSKPDNTVEQLTSASHPQPRPVRQAVLKGHEKVQ